MDDNFKLLLRVNKAIYFIKKISGRFGGKNKMKTKNLDKKIIGL